MYPINPLNNSNLLMKCFRTFQNSFTILVLGLVCFCQVNLVLAADKILHINSYHPGYAWSDGITHGIQSRLATEDVWFSTHYMDTKRFRSNAEIEAAAKTAIQVINKLEPDVVIVSDDNAVKYVLAKHFKNKELKFVFSGVNWDASVYGLPFENATGIEEIALVNTVVDLIRRYTNGDRIGFLSIDSITGRRNHAYFQSDLGKSFHLSYFSNTFEEWKSQFHDLQNKVDLIILENPEGIENWNADSAQQFIDANIRIPVGTTHVWLATYALLAVAKIPEEQGWWAAEAAIKILSGVPPSDIPVSQNKQGKLLLNLDIAEKIDVVFETELLEIAEIIRKQYRKQ